MSSAPAAAPRSPWIISPAWDLLYIVATPLLIVPLVLLVERQLFTPAQILLFVTAFATLGHHLPGFMRAYGDRELFERFRWRFLLVPPLVFTLALLLVPPPSLALRLGLPYTSLYGLELVLLLWGTWHGLMQTFGFMRIYDLKRGVADAWTARLDFWLCASLFAVGVVFSDSRVFGLMNVAWRSGVPIVDRAWLDAARWIVGGAMVLIACAYVLNALQIRQRHGVNWIKLALAATTGGLYWFSGYVTTNLVVGIAMFEIFHAVQYFAIVWIYNRRLAQRVGERFGMLGFLFRERWTMLGLYLASIAAFGAIRLWAGDSDDVDTIARNADAFALIAAAFTASTLLHFYFDGFIWKVSQSSTAVNLDISNTACGINRFVPGLIHAGKWALLFTAIGALVLLQLRPGAPAQVYSDARVWSALASWTPNLPESQIHAATVALDARNYDTALSLAHRAAAERPRSHQAQAKLGEVQLAVRQFDQATAAFRAALALAPNRWRYKIGLAQALNSHGETDQAILVLEEARSEHPDVGALTEELIALLVREAQTRYRAGQLDDARRRYEALLVLAPEHTGERFLLGSIQLSQGDHAAAEKTFAQLVEQTPKEPKARMMLGNAQAAAGKLPAAEASLRAALALAPKGADIHYNLGLVLLQANRVEEARTHIRRAEGFGVRPSPEVLEAIR